MSLDTPRTAVWYFDFISPYAYLQLEQFHRLPASLAIECKPIVFGAVLNHWGQLGPAEMPGKRIHTYRYTQFRAGQLGIPFRLPPAHPFNSLHANRLAVALGASREVVQKIFRFIWKDGRAVATENDLNALCNILELDAIPASMTSDNVKQQLRTNTEQAIAAGIFGVPSFVVDDEIFWGEDATAMLLHYLENPQWLQSEELQRIAHLPVGVQRQRTITEPAK